MTCIFCLFGNLMASVRARAPHVVIIFHTESNEIEREKKLVSIDIDRKSINPNQLTEEEEDENRGAHSVVM